MNYIYCYINKINQHKYVGQTNNLKRRMREHKSCAFNEKSRSYNHLIHQKIREYGIDEFDIEVLEIIYENNQNYVNERERYWIQDKSSFRGTGKGYNSDLGGGVKNKSNLSQEAIVDIKQMISEGIPFIEIGEKYKISDSFISGINHGYYFFEEKDDYPLYRYYKTDEDYDELIDLLVNSSMRMSDIAKHLQIGYSTIKKINSGKLRNGLYPTYPIRKKSANEMRADVIKDLLSNSDYSKTYIANFTNSDLETVRRINSGISFYDKTLNYPLRNL